MAGPVFFFSLQHQIFTLKSASLAALIPLQSSFIFFVAQQFNITPLLALISRPSSSKINGVIYYGILWALWPFSRYYGIQKYILVGLICFTFGDGFAGYGELFKTKKTGQKTYQGLALFIIGGVLGFYIFKFELIDAIIFSIISAIIEFNTQGFDDNLIIFISMSGFSYIYYQINYF
ncbi:Transmembrane domain-containing protein [Spironucleus salmonicida]|nr:Transmembrane domain-containing protein [Spironucleus salmonicida]